MSELKQVNCDGRSFTGKIKQALISLKTCVLEE